ncbi:MAG: hypothetical protein H6765_01875 [Candidatus Peribacteria bacterium]|nr:MAG: hypothetical protein H6765_01875 [Candidatus Peribacteria bacterium]
MPLTPTCSTPVDSSNECPNNEPCVGRCAVTFNKCISNTDCPSNEACVAFDTSS